MNEYFSALTGYIDAIRYIQRFRLWIYLLVPGIISFIYFVLVFFLTIQYTPDLTDYLYGLITGRSESDDVWSIIIRIILYMLVIVFFLLSFKHVTLAALSPFLSRLSEVIEKRIGATEPPPLTLKMLLSDLIRGIRINLFLLWRSVLYSVLASLSALIPVVGVFISPFWLFMIQAYYTGFALGDFTLERKRFNVNESITFGRQNRWRITGVGTGFMLLLFVPLIGWFVAPTLGTIAATIDLIKDDGLEIDKEK